MSSRLSDAATELSCPNLLDGSGTFRHADLRWAAQGWRRFSVAGPGRTAGDYVVPLLPVDLHCHGIGEYDFSDMRGEDLPLINRLARAEGVSCVPTLYLRPDRFDHFLRLVRDYAALAKAGEVPQLLGFGLEGPLLGSSGGTPKEGRWWPTREQWQALCRSGELGLRYIVLAPDSLASEASGAGDKAGPSMEWILSTLVEAGIKPAFGHFRGDSPSTTARAIEAALDIVERVLGRPTPSAIITDHLFNDMPRAFRHAWRTPGARQHREAELERFRRSPPSWGDVDVRYGEVPAALLRAARDGRLLPCLNFDGDHVDLEFCRQVVELLGPDRVIGITDRVERHQLLGNALKPSAENSLLYQDEGLVAAGTQGIDRQMQNMRKIGLDEAQLWKIFGFTPARALGLATPGDTPPLTASYVFADHTRTALYRAG